MRSLFLKIFLWFWATAILTGVALLVTFILQPGGVPARWHEALTEAARSYGRAAVGEMEQGGTSAANSYLEDLDRNAHIKSCLFDQNSKEIAGNRCDTFHSLVERSAISDAPAFGIRYGIIRVGLRVAGRGSYIFATELPAGPRAALGPDFRSLALHWAVAFLVSGFVCYLLARYLTMPIFQLREASQRLASGNLSTRALTQGHLRRDEIGELVRDFNSMAEQIEALVSSQRQLISDVSHELRSPLARLTVALDLARTRKGNDPAFDRMEKDFDRLSEMLARLLTVARLDSSSASVEMAPLNLSVLVSEVAADAEFEAGNRKCGVKLSIDENIFVRGNPDLLRSAIENIVRNALRYTDEGTYVELSLRRETTAGLISAVLSVRDHGPGVAEAELKNIFRPFYRVASARDRQTGGIGLGLAIADRVARLHGGTLDAVNWIGGGLEVLIRIPVQASHNETPTNWSTESRPA